MRNLPATHDFEPSSFANPHSHLTTLRNNHILIRLIILPNPHILNLPHNIHALHDLPKNNMLAIQMRRRSTSDEELRPIRIRPTILKNIISI